jgi:uncharacterized protein YndB with AHSA1/START domain
VAIRAAPAEVWRAIVEPELEKQWMGMRLECSWEVGSPITLTDTPLGPGYVERGTLLAFEPDRLLRYDHWSKLWRVPDLPANRAVLTLRVDAGGDGSRVTFHHDLPAVEALAEHSDFFWRVGLGLLKQLLEA